MMMENIFPMVQGEEENPDNLKQIFRISDFNPTLYYLGQLLYYFSGCAKYSIGLANAEDLVLIHSSYIRKRWEHISV
jgi:hypothetical protein